MEKENCLGSMCVDCALWPFFTMRAATVNWVESLAAPWPLVFQASSWATISCFLSWMDMWASILWHSTSASSILWEKREVAVSYTECFWQKGIIHLCVWHIHTYTDTHIQIYVHIYIRTHTHTFVLYGYSNLDCHWLILTVSKGWNVEFSFDSQPHSQTDKAVKQNKEAKGRETNKNEAH